MEPNPPAVILARIQAAIEPTLVAAGFHLGEQSQSRNPLFHCLDYVRNGNLFRLSWDRWAGFLKAEQLEKSDGYKLIAIADFSDMAEVPNEIAEKVDSFIQTIMTVFFGGGSSLGDGRH